MPTGPARTPQRIPPARTGNPPAVASRLARAAGRGMEPWSGHRCLCPAGPRRSPGRPVRPDEGPAPPDPEAGQPGHDRGHDRPRVQQPVHARRGLRPACPRHRRRRSDADALNKTLERTRRSHARWPDRVIGLARQRDTAIKAVKLKPVVENAIGCLCRDLGEGQHHRQRADRPGAGRPSQRESAPAGAVQPGDQRPPGHAGPPRPADRRRRSRPDGMPCRSTSATRGCGIAPENLQPDLRAVLHHQDQRRQARPRRPGPRPVHLPAR